MAVNELGPIGGSGLGPFGEIFKGGKTAGILAVTDTVSKIIGMLTVAASIWFLLQILFAGYEWMSAGGDTKKIASARDRITHAFIGLIIVVGSWSLVAVTGQFFGFNTLVNPGEVIQNLSLPGGN
jgi:hypothetical protein